ncbi:MAG: DmsE family decaheme c-type cytochrome [Nitrospiraceae bacterium]|nr:DmsE family decaheme c-type cytochrome [Nitrospiraceae bacterium]
MISFSKGLFPVWLCLLVALFTVSGCESLKTSKPLIPIKQYEKMIVGRYDADYVGTANCLRACHYHDQIKKDFEASTMGAQLSTKSGLPIVDCESCHGPGSLAIEGLTPEKVEEAQKKGIQLACNYKTLIDIKTLPAGARSLICLKCHTANATFNLHTWNMSPHALNDVSCSDCHNVHHGPDLKVSPRDTAAMCYRCHQNVKAEFNLLSHHPVPEEKIFCTDCHDPHGSITGKMLRKETVKATCTQCHGEKEGPFVYEHAENTEDCLACHNQHGSPNNFLLKLRVPFLCLQCHEGHTLTPMSGFSASPTEWKAAFYTRCTDCHSQIHGTDLPSAIPLSGGGGAGRFTR